MAIIPTDTDPNVIEVDEQPETSRTYAIFDDFGGIVDGLDAVRQFVKKAIMTARFRFFVYNSEYGCELDELIGQDVSEELLRAEIPRIIREALIYDERILDVRGFDIRREGDALYITFTVDTTLGTIYEEVAV